MRKTIKSIIALSLFIGVLYSCNSSDIATESPVAAISYDNFKIGNLTSGEIGALHNSALQVLKDNGKLKSSVSEIVVTLQNNSIDNRISNVDIDNSMNNLYQIKFFNKNLNSTFSKKVNTDNFQEDALNYLISKNEISINAKNEIDNLSTLSIPEMKLKTNELLISDNYSNREKQYFAVYTSIYENSITFWSTNNSTSKTSKTARWQPYAADAVGGILGLYAGPVWSIIQGAAVSAAFD